MLTISDLYLVSTSERKTMSQPMDFLYEGHPVSHDRNSCREARLLLYTDCGLCLCKLQLPFSLAYLSFDMFFLLSLGFLLET